MTVATQGQLLAAKCEAERHRDTIAEALKAMDEGRYGDARRILRGGQAKPLMTNTGVIAKDAP